MKRPIQHAGDFIKNNLALICIVILAIALRIAWTVFTKYTFEDAFITFQYARRISQGAGFVYNPGERICGTTTPLLSLLLAGWMGVFGENSVIFGAKFIGLLASLFSFVFLLLSLRSLGFNSVQQGFALSLLVIWPKLWLVDTGGMETSLVILFITSSWYTYLKGNYIWTGILGGLLLWTRLDALLWVLLISGFEFFREPKNAIKVLGTASFTYLPWIVFSWTYFGSPIPYSIVAKQAAYAKYNSAPYLAHMIDLIKRSGPVGSLSFPGSFRGIPAAITFLVFAAALGTALLLRKNKHILLLAIFPFLELLRLILTRATFASRYVIPALYIILVLSGIGIGSVWERIRDRRPHRALFMTTAAAFSIFVLALGIKEAILDRQIQLLTHEEALQNIGDWLNENTEKDASVQLEPLGYAGYYANRRMLDVVGLITPPVVSLKKAGIAEPFLYLPILEPDYVVAHCDDIIRWQEMDQKDTPGYLKEYRQYQVFNPLGFDPGAENTPLDMDIWLSRTSCYEIWGVE